MANPESNKTNIETIKVPFLSYIKLFSESLILSNDTNSLQATIIEERQNCFTFMFGANYKGCLPNESVVPILSTINSIIPFFNKEVIGRTSATWGETEDNDYVECTYRSHESEKGTFGLRHKESEYRWWILSKGEFCMLWHLFNNYNLYLKNKN